MTEDANRGRRWNPLAWAVVLLAAVVLAIVLLLLQAALRSPEPPPEAGVEVPDIVGLAEGAAIQRIEEAGLSVGMRTDAPDDAVEAGLVADQDPEPGSVVPRGSAVAYIVSIGAARPTGPAPSGTPSGAPGNGGQPVGDYRCLTLAAATSAIVDDGFDVGDVAYTLEGGPVDDSWLVTRQQPAPEEPRPVGTAVDLVLSSPFFPCPATS